MKLVEGLILLVILIITTVASEENHCDYNETYSDYFYCSDLTSNSSEYVKTSLSEAIDMPYNISVRFDNSSISEQSDDLFSGYNVTYFQCFWCIMEEFPLKIMLSFGEILERIDIVDSYVGTIGPSLVQDLPFMDFITEINIVDGNNISHIDSWAFSNYSALTDLYMYDNDWIGQVADYAFAGVPSLDLISFFYNHVQFLPQHVFYDLPSLTKLWLYDDDLQTMEIGTFNDEDLPNLSLLYIYGNPWYCNCSLQWLKDYIILHPDTDYNVEPRCELPEEAYFHEIDFCNWEEKY